MDRHYPVKIAMVAYNQEKYIAQAIESVLMQKTVFDYRLIIGDDCSNDSTATICAQYVEKYPDKVELISNPKNIGLLANYKQLFDNFPAKYIAILEGDDYWTDENKLQFQFDLLENNPHIGLVHTDCDLLFESGKLQSGSHQRHIGSIKNGIVFEQLLYENYIRPATVMFRQELFGKYVPVNEYIRLSFTTLDYPMWLDISYYTQFYYIPTSTAAYRIHRSSISNSNRHEKIAGFFQSIYDIKSYALEKFACSVALRKSLINRCIFDQITIEMEFQKYNNVYRMAQNLAILNFKSLMIRLLATNRFLIDLYAYYLRYRGSVQKS